MATYAHLKNAFTEDEKDHNLMSRLIYKKSYCRIPAVFTKNHFYWTILGKILMQTAAKGSATIFPLFILF